MAPLVRRGIGSRALTLLASVGVVWVVSFYALADPSALYALAIIPRDVNHLVGIVGMPFVHHSLAHLMANTGPLLALGTVMLFRGVGYYAVATTFIILLSGVAVWGFGRSAAHIGASGVVFGLAGFLVVRGLYERRPGSAAVALLVFLIYGGMIWGVIPQDDGVSWESHLFGLIAGIVTARAFAAKARAEAA